MTRRAAARAAAVLWLPVGVAAGESAAPCPFRVAALVQAGPANWPRLPDDATIRPAAATRFVRPYLEPGPGIPVKSPAVAKALAEALAPLAAADRRNVRTVLDALGEWAAVTLAEDHGPVPAAGTWRDAARVLADRRGHAFERLRALTALARAAGIPARPTFNGVPVMLVHATKPGGPGIWTVWDPFHPVAAARLLPVAWLPLRGGDLPPVVFEPAGMPVGPLHIEVRRYGDRGAAALDLGAVRATGRFLPEPPPPLPAGALDWWELWIIGADPVPPAGRWSAVVALPYVRDLEYGTREHAVWIAEPARPPAVTGPLSETDPAAGGIVMTLKLSFPAVH